MMFGDEDSQSMADSNCKIMGIARKNKTKIMHQIIFKVLWRRPKLYRYKAEINELIIYFSIIINYIFNVS